MFDVRSRLESSSSSQVLIRLCFCIVLPYVVVVVVRGVVTHVDAVSDNSHARRRSSEISLAETDRNTNMTNFLIDYAHEKQKCM